MRHLPLAAIGTAAALLTACASLNSKVVDPLVTDLSKISNTATADLIVADNVALAATPPDKDGDACIKAAQVVQGQVVAVVNSTWPIFFRNSSKFSGRLSLADGSRKPCSTRTLLRAWSPLNMPRTCGIVTWDSSMIVRNSSGK